MNKYDDQYYFIRWEMFNEKIPHLVPNDSTSMLNYSFEAVPPGSPPLIFHNIQKTENIAKGIREEIGEVLFEGAELIVSTRIREALLDYDIPHLHMHPAIYIDDRDEWHENYWYMTFTKRFTCWDKAKSEYSDPDIIMLGEKIYDVDAYVFDEDLLDKTPLEQRLLFKMGGNMEGFITVHQKLVPLFAASDKKNPRFQRVVDY